MPTLSRFDTVLAGELYTPHLMEGPYTLQIANGQVSALQPGLLSTASAVLDARDALVVPGLVDLQVNGGLGWSFQAGDRAHFDEIARFHLERGTTTLLPTLITAPAENLRQSLATLAQFCRESHPYTLAGIHLEGPFLAPAKAGAHDRTALCLPDAKLLEELIHAAAGALKLVTLAPELPGALELIPRLIDAGVVVSAGHSTATYACLQAAVAAGLTLLTHLGNASDWPGRALNEFGFMGSEPGLVGAYLAIPQLAGSVIMDGFHFHPALLKPLAELKGPNHLVLVSDASTVTGLPPGEYQSGGLIANVHSQGFATSGRGGGWLAGSVITLLPAVQRAVQLAGLPLTQALTLACQTPARRLGLGARKGHLRPGADADLLILNHDLSLRHVVVAGQVVQ